MERELPCYLSISGSPLNPTPLVIARWPLKQSPRNRRGLRHFAWASLPVINPARRLLPFTAFRVGCFACGFARSDNSSLLGFGQERPLKNQDGARPSAPSSIAINHSIPSLAYPNATFSLHNPCRSITPSPNRCSRSHAEVWEREFSTPTGSFLYRRCAAFRLSV